MVPEIIDMDMPVEGVFHNLVIAQVKKEYAGQGQKVMNAMWGAGQMMFNKILVMADEHVRIQDYKALAKYVFANLDVSADIYFSSGPMDVLDHSCSKMGFGGKMCIDGTAKFDEETDPANHMPNVKADPVQLRTSLASFTEVQKINLDLLANEIPCIVLSVEKNRPGHIRELHSALGALPAMEGVKMILYVEHTVDAADLTTALWRFCNNLDPKRDQLLIQRPSQKENGKTFSCIGFDGTRKTKTFDNFTRDWPNIIVADEKTIESIDKKWDQLGLGSFVSSPSLRFRDQLYGEEAVVAAG
jgi:4-hydroxy-3-polyprenylbenzoate decarboxylase